LASSGRVAGRGNPEPRQRGVGEKAIAELPAGSASFIRSDESMRILLTGSSGTIGTRLFEVLSSHHEVTGVDIRRNKWNLKLDSVTLNADLRDSGCLEGLSPEFDLIIHLAANARVYELVERPELAFDNMLINYNVLEFMRKKRIARMIYASSRETYGNIMEGTAIAEDRVRLENCESPYAASKMAGEAMIHGYARTYGMECVILRFSNVYGMYDDSDRVVPLWIKGCMRGTSLTVFGRDKSLDFTYIDDAVDGVVRVVDRFDKVKGNTFNIARGEEVRLLEVAEGIKALLGCHSENVIRESRPGEVRKYRADISKAEGLLGFRPQVGIEEGLRRTVQWYLERRDDFVGT
jgi:UDP-glucose 4-epimerase